MGSAGPRTCSNGSMNASGPPSSMSFLLPLAVCINTLRLRSSSNSACRLSFLVIGTIGPGGGVSSFGTVQRPRGRFGTAVAGVLLVF